MKQELVISLSPADVRLAVERFVRTEARIAGDVSVSLLESGGAVAKADPWPPLVDLDVIEGLPELDEDLPF